MMRYRKHHDLTTSEVGIGCYTLSGVYGKKDLGEYKRMLRRAYELGVNFYDTAEAYGNAEQILGHAVKPYRHRIYIATKVGIKEGAKPDLSSAYVIAACEESLGQLQTDYIDLYQVHFDDPDTPVGETVGALEDLVRQGKIRHYGIGHLPADRIAAYFKMGNVFSVLVELSAVAREARQTTLPICQKHGAGAIAFSVTGRGMLTGRFHGKPVFEAGDIRNIDPLFQRERFQSGLRVAERLADVGARYGKSPVQVAIAWVLAQPGIICALTGPSTVAHLEENVTDSGWRLPSNDLEGLEAIFRQEDARLRREQEGSINGIVSHPLPEDPDEGFRDLVYAIEATILLGWVEEKDVLPVFLELFGLREALDTDARPRLENVQRQLRELILEAATVRSGPETLIDEESVRRRTQGK